MADTEAIKRCREALEIDDMLSVATRVDWSDLLAERDKLRHLIKDIHVHGVFLHGAACRPPEDCVCELRDLLSRINEALGAGDGN